MIVLSQGAGSTNRFETTLMFYVELVKFSFLFLFFIGYPGKIKVCVYNLFLVVQIQIYEKVYYCKKKQGVAKSLGECTSISVK